jgi:tRNA threonylcarbamoyladenosine biosynthesis protein TsaE
VMSVPVVVTTDGPAATRALGEALSGLLTEGDVVLLTGDLGAGKTVLVQGIAAGLGIVDDVTSPTFALVDEHRAPSGLRLLHVDVYRLDDPREIIDLGLGEEVDDGSTVAVVEWGEKAAAALGGDRLEVVLSDGDRQDDRTFTFTLVGPGWEARRGQLHLARGRLAVDPDADSFEGVLG